MESAINTNPVLAGQILTDWSLEELASELAAAFDRCEVRDSAHFTLGRYIRIDWDSEVMLTFEKVLDGEFLVGGEADDGADLLKAAKFLTEVLFRLKLSHRMEVYEGDELIEETVFNWVETPFFDTGDGVEAQGST